MDTTIKYGLTAGLAISVYTLLLSLMGLDASSGLGMINYIILLSGLFIGIKEIKEHELNGYIKFGTAWKSGFFISLYAGIIYALYMYLHLSFIQPDYIEKLLEIAEASYEDFGFTGEQLESSMKLARIMYTPVSLTFMSLLSTLAMGMLLSLIPSLALKLDPPSETESL